MKIRQEAEAIHNKIDSALNSPDELDARLESIFDEIAPPASSAAAPNPATVEAPSRFAGAASPQALEAKKRMGSALQSVFSQESVGL